jgi:SHS2 domain-containing protein
MTDRNCVEEDPQYTTKIRITGGDVGGLLYNFLDELLFRFSAEPFLVGKRIVIDAFDIHNGTLEATWYD